LKRDLIWLSAFTAAAFSILSGLGFWQLQRLQWKQDLISRIETRIRAEPVSLPEADQLRNRTGDIEFLRVSAEGRYDHDKERHLYTVMNGKAGWRIFTPLETRSGRIVMIDRGFVPEELKESGARPEGQLAGTVRATGLVRVPARQGLFTPENAPEKNTWYWRDLKGMASSVLSGEQEERLAPYFVQLETAPVPGGWPQAAAAQTNLPNRHFGYALTWFGLAAGLFVVFAVYVRGRLRR
jgi:surfeit locus 1 family protein